MECGEHLARPSAKPPSNKATGCCTARRTCCWMICPGPTPLALARSSRSRSAPYLRDFAVCELLLATAEDLPEIIMRRYELASTPHTFNLSAEDCN